MTAHLSAIIQGATLLALAGVMGFSNLPDAIETIAAAPLVGGAVLFVRLRSSSACSAGFDGAQPCDNAGYPST